MGDPEDGENTSEGTVRAPKGKGLRHLQGIEKKMEKVSLTNGNTVRWQKQNVHLLSAAYARVRREFGATYLTFRPLLRNGVFLL